MAFKATLVNRIYHSENEVSHSKLHKISPCHFLEQNFVILESMLKRRRLLDLSFDLKFSHEHATTEIVQCAVFTDPFHLES